MQCSGLVVGEVFVHHWDLGSIPRSPKISIHFFFTCLCVGSKRRSIMHLAHPACQVSPGSNPKIRREGTPYSPVNYAMDNCKSQMCLATNWASDF